MCIAPKKMWITRGIGNEQIEVPCGNCWRCQRNRQDDLEGRGLLELQSATWAVVLTLTYADHEKRHHEFVAKEDFQNFMRAVRNKYASKGATIKYLVAGEYGSRKGRAHFHVLLLGQPGSTRPEWPDRRNFHPLAWPHGHVFADWNVHARSLSYILKYLQKDKEAWVSWSKQPILGHEAIVARAREYVQNKVVPRGFEYVPPGGRNSSSYAFSGAASRTLINEIFKRWPEFIERPMTDWVRNEVVRWAKWRHERDWNQLTKVQQMNAVLDTFQPRGIPKPQPNRWQRAKDQYFAQFEGKHKWLVEDPRNAETAIGAVPFHRIFARLLPDPPPSDGSQIGE